jgi:pilus assembly protein CpaC
MHLRKNLLVLGLAATALPVAAGAQTPNMMAPIPDSALAAPVVNIGERQTSGQMTIPAGKSQLLHVDQTFGEISVGNRDIADVIPLSRNLIYVLGKKLGTTNITIQNARGDIVAVVDVAIAYDIDGLNRDLKDLVPGEKVAIRPAGESLILTGQVSSSDKVRQILSIADRYAPNAITNLMSLNGSQQVLLQVKFAEVQRTALKQLGTNIMGGATPAESLPGASPTGAVIDTGQGIPRDAFGVLGAIFGDQRYNIAATVDALERQGALRTLAEPNLVALSGDTASFLAGGQIPIPVVQAMSGTAAIPLTTIQYKDFGVGISFTPTVISKEAINLEVNSEVSSIDPTIGVQTNSIVVPGLKVRRARTTIELKDGQAFSIAGLLQDDFQDNVAGLPLLQRLPVLGALFRSTRYQQQQTELVVLITVHLVDPGLTANLASPAGTLVIPTEGELFGKGNVEGGAASGGAGNGSGYVLP